MSLSKRIRVVLVKDTDDDAFLISEELDEGFDVIRITDGEKACAYLLAPEVTPDVVLMDVRLPGMNGLDIIRALREAGRELAYIRLTVDMQIDTAIAVMKAGALDFLPKSKGYDLLPGMIVKVHRIHQDRQERRRVEEALRESEARYRTLAEENVRLLEQARKDADTQAALLHEVNHRVKNNLTAILGLLYTEQQYAPEPERPAYRNILEELAARIRTMAVVHNMLSASHWQPLALEEVARQVLQASARMAPSGKSIEIAVAPCQMRLSAKQANNVALALNELATNTLKYAFGAQSRIRIEVSLACDAEGVTVTYRDSGPGYPDDVLTLQRRNVGLHLLYMLIVDDLGGTVALSNEQGAVAALRLTMR